MIGYAASSASRLGATTPCGAPTEIPDRARAWAERPAGRARLLAAPSFRARTGWVLPDPLRAQRGAPPSHCPLPTPPTQPPTHPQNTPSTDKYYASANQVVTEAVASIRVIHVRGPARAHTCVCVHEGRGAVVERGAHARVGRGGARGAAEAGSSVRVIHVRDSVCVFPRALFSW